MNTNHSRASVLANFRGTENRRRAKVRRRAKIIVACAVGPIVAALAPWASAGVQLTSVAAGSAAVSQQGAVTTIRTGTNNTILYFSKFDIAGGSTVNFVQPSAMGRVLDHVTSATPSMINGTLQSNGSVYLINPAGVIFGAGAVVDVNRFYAAAANFSNQDFLNGVDHFTGVSGMVSNSGQIRANQVSLIGSQVVNEGNIIAPNGYVAMLAGPDVLVSVQGSHITAKVNSPAPLAGAAAGASGGTSGSGGTASQDLRNSPMAAGDVYSLAIRHTGTITASNVLINGGQGKVQVSGSIDVSSHAAGSVGGNVAITGGEVDLASANINASGPGGGGTIEIGGGVHGSGDLAHAQIVSVDSGSVIDADAVSNGAGGTISLWSDGTTSDAGTISARGGSLGGNGGFIETSGAVLNVTSAPNASAPHGMAGTWLLDPTDVEIVNAANDGTQITGTNPVSNNGSTVNNGTIDTALDAGTNVTISTDQVGLLGNLTQDADAPIAVTLTGPATLTLESDLAMTLPGGISTAGGSQLNVVLNALGGAGNAVNISSPININGSLTIHGGDVTVASGGNLTATSITFVNGPVVGLSGSSFPAVLGVVVIDAPIASTAGAVSITTASSITSNTGGTITAVGGNVTLGSTGAVSIGAVVNTGGGALGVTGTSFTNSAQISDGGSNTTNPFTVNTSSGIGTININGAISWAGTGGVNIEGGGVVSSTAAGTITSEGSTAVPVSLFSTAAGGTVTVDGNVNINGAFTASGGAFTLGATNGLIAKSASINLATVTTLDAKSVTPTTVSIVDAVTTTGNLQVGGLSLSSTATTGTISTGGGNFTITVSTGTTLNAPVTTGGGNFSVAGSLFTLAAGATLGTSGGGVSITSAGPDSIGAAVTTGAGTFSVGGSTSFTSTAAGTITTTNGAVSIGSTGAVLVGAEVITGGAAFTATGVSFENDAEITDGGANTGNTPFSVNTSAAAGTIDINGAISWAGTGGVLIEGATTVTTNVAGTLTGNGATPISLFTIGTGVNNGVTINGTVSTGGLFKASGANFTLATTTSGVTAGSASINVAVLTPDSKTIVPSTTTINESVSTTAVNGFTGAGTTFTSVAGGTITTTGGGPVIITTTTGTTLGGAVSASGAFTVSAGINFQNNAAISGGSISTNPAFSVSTAGSGTININGAITWAGTGGVTISGTNQVTTTPLGTITSTSTGNNATPVSLFTSFVDGSIGTTGVTIGAGVTTLGAFTASGGNFILSANVPLSAASESLNVVTAIPGGGTATPNTVTISGPVMATAAGGAINIGGLVLVTDNTTGTLTANNGAITISNTGLIGMGNAIVTGGGNFTVTNGANFTTSGAPITTSGGDVLITTSTSDGVQISTDSPVNTGGGNFKVVAQAFENDSTITDGGVATAGKEVNIDATTGANPSLDAVNINSPIIWTGGTGRNVDVEGNGTVSIVTITSSGATPLPVTVFTTGGSGSSVTIGGAVNTSGTFTSSGSLVSVSAAGSIVAQAVSLNIATATTNGHAVVPGDVSVAGPITTNAGTFTSGGTSFTSSGIGAITTNGGVANLLTPGGINIGAAISTGGGAFNATNDNAFTSTTGGTITTLGGAVTINSIGTVANSTGEIVIGDEINTGGGAFSSNGSTFTSSGEITDGGINDGQSVAITTTGGDITLNTGGDINWAASLGSITFIVPAGSTLGLGATITGNVAEPINFTGVTLSLVGTASTITGGNIAIGTIANPDNTKSPNLAIQSAGTVSMGVVGTPTSPVGSLTVINNGSSAAPVTTLTGNINSTGTVDFAGSVILAANITIAATDLAASPVDHLVEFDGTIEGPNGLTILLPNPPNVQNGPNVEEVRFNSNIGDQTPLAFLNVTSNIAGIVFFRAGVLTTTATSEFGNLPGVDDPQPLTVVNIASGGSFKINDTIPSPKQSSIIISSIDSYGPLTVNIGAGSSPNAANLFAVGQYEKLTSFGALTINTNGGTAQIEDLSSFGDMTISAASVEFLLRQPTLENNVSLDKGVDLIASGQMTLPAGAVYTAVSPSGPGAFGVPGFIAGSFNPSSNIPAIAGSLDTAISIAPSIPASAFFFPGFNLLLDLTPSTLTSRLPTFVPPIPFVFDLPVGGAVPRQQLVAGTVTPDFKNAMMPSYPGPVVQQDLNDTGVNVREPSIEEIVDATDSIVVYNDTPRKRRPRAEDFNIAVTRLNSARVQTFLDQYKEMFSGSQGNANMPSRRAQIATDMQGAWDAYVGQNGYKRATGAGFQRYAAKTPSASKAASELVQLNSLFKQLDTLGLSHKEAQMFFQHNVLAGLPANGMQDGDLIAAVESAGNE